MVRWARRFAIHATSLMRSVLIVFIHVEIEVILHFDDVFIELGATLDSEVFVEKGSMEPFEEAVALRAANLGGAVFDPFELEEEFVRVSVGSATKLPSVV